MKIAKSSFTQAGQTANITKHIISSEGTWLGSQVQWDIGFVAIGLILESTTWLGLS